MKAYYDFLSGAGRLLLVILVAISFGACDRVFSEDPEDEPDDRLELGTFEAQAGEFSNQGFEALEGRAAFEVLSRIGDTPVFVLSLTSQLPNFDAPTRLNFAMVTSGLPAEGTYGIADPNDETTEYFVACFSSPNFQESPYESESGEFIVTASGSGRIEGTFDMIAYALVSTGPTSSERVRLEISGSVNARAGGTNAQPAAIFDCVEGE